MKKNKLAYSFLNEDPHCELSVLPNSAKTVACIAGSGYRVLPFLSADHVQTIYIVDQSILQLDQAKSVLRSLHEPNYQTFVDKIKPTSPSSPLYQGRHEQSYKIRSILLRILFGPQFQGNVDLTTLKRWPLFVKIYSFILKRTRKDRSPDINYADYIKLSFHKLIRTDYRKNFFWQQLIKGRAETLDAFSELITEKIWEQAKNNLPNIKIHFIHQDINEFLASKKNELDFISFSNVLNYLNPVEKMKMINAVPRALTSQGRILFRSYIDEIYLVSDQLNENTQYVKVFENEMTGSYRIKLYEKI